MSDRAIIRLIFSNTSNGNQVHFRVQVSINRQPFYFLEEWVREQLTPQFYRNKHSAEALWYACGMMHTSEFFNAIIMFTGSWNDIQSDIKAVAQIQKLPLNILRKLCYKDVPDYWMGTAISDVKLTEIRCKEKAPPPIG